MPVLGVIGEQNVYGAYSVQMLRLDPDDRVEVMCDKELQLNHIYFFLYEIARDTVANIGSEQIIPCESESIVESIESHSKIKFVNW